MICQDLDYLLKKACNFFVSQNIFSKKIKNYWKVDLLARRRSSPTSYNDYYNHNTKHYSI